MGRSMATELHGNNLSGRTKPGSVSPRLRRSEPRLKMVQTAGALPPCMHRGRHAGWSRYGTGGSKNRAVRQVTALAFIAALDPPTQAPGRALGLVEGDAGLGEPAD